MTDKYMEAQTRVEFLADTLGLNPPSRFLSEDDAPAPELLTFCRETGMSLDLAFCGDLRPMVRATFKANNEGVSQCSMIFVWQNPDTDPHRLGFGVMTCANQPGFAARSPKRARRKGLLPQTIARRKFIRMTHHCYQASYPCRGELQISWGIQ